MNWPSEISSILVPSGKCELSCKNETARERFGQGGLQLGLLEYTEISIYLLILLSQYIIMIVLSMSILLGARCSQSLWKSVTCNNVTGNNHR